MSGGASRAPRLPRRLLRRLLPGAVGADALADLGREHERLRQARGRVLAWLWYSGHLLRPGTWALARALRRTEVRRPQEEISRAASRARLGISWLDVKLGLRILRKYPGLTFVSGLAMSVTIAIAVGMFGVFQDYLLRPVVPLPEGERIVSIGMLATERGLTHRQLLHDFFVWRDEMETVLGHSLGRRAPQNLVGADGRAEPASIAMMSASGFDVARVPPLMGRPLLDADEIPGAPPVLVLGYDAWQRRFEGDPDIVGRTGQIGRVEHTIVGVMPEGFRFPLAEQLWIPLTDDPDDWAVMETPYSYFAFGRLAPGVTMAQAQAELSSISSRRFAQMPGSYEHVRAIVMSYTDPHTGMDNAGSTLLVRVMLGVFSLFVLIPFVNVAILVYARTATRAGEIAIRSALGASRRRVVTQLFVEALVLASLAAAAGVGMVLFILAQVRAFLAGIGADNLMPFWAKNGQDPWALAYVVALTMLAAVVAGVIPGLEATGRGVREGLARAGNGNGMKLGRGWTALIVTQVAITVALLPLVGSAGWGIIGLGLSRPAFDAESLVAARIAGDPMASLEGSAAEDPEARRAERAERTRQAIEEVARSIEADPRVTELTLATNVPGTLFEASILLDVEGVDPPLDAPAHRVGGGMSVAGDFFEVIGVTATSGRTLVAADARTEAPPIVVNRSFAEKVLGGANPVGRRVRWYRPEGEEPEPWREIVGLVENMVRNPTHPESIEARISCRCARPRSPTG
jgi:predicted permease